MDDAYQVFADCPNCHVEGAVIELIDPSIAEGVSVEARCRLCGREEALGAAIFGGRVFEVEGDVRRALEEWAIAEEYPSVEEFCEANMGGLGLDEVFHRLLNGEKIETNFDVVAYLFPSMMGGGSARSGKRQDRMAGRSSRQAQTPEPTPSVEASKSLTLAKDPCKSEVEAPERVMARALAAVMVADGRIRRAELQYLAGALEKRGLPALVDEDVRPWRPADLAEPHDPLEVIQVMIGLAYIDHHRDGTEWRVIREFARFWRVPMDQVEALGKERESRDATQVAVLWRGFKSLFVTEGR
jgi:uncharacterized tellurite resistance protein B-like protein